jgi:hypothetical protein
MMDGIPQKGSHGSDPNQCVILYMYVCALFFFFVTIKVTTRSVHDGCHVPTCMCSSLSRCICVPLAS